MDLALQRALEAVRHIGDPTPPWHDILESSRALVGGDSATFVMFEERQLVCAEHAGVAEAAIRDYVQHFHPHDILLRSGPLRLSGEWLDSSRILSTAQRGKNAYYADFMCPHRMRHMLSFVVEETEMRSVAITVHRSDVRDDTQSSLRSEPIVAYGRALQQAFAARREQAGRLLRGAEMALDDFGHAGCLVSGRGQVVWASRAGWKLLEQSALRVRRGRWWHPDDSVRTALAGALLRATDGGGAGSPLRVVVPDAGRASMALDVLPADPRLRWGHEALAFVRMRACGPVRPVPVDSLCMAFRISPAEARVLAALMNGETLADHARAHGVSIHTVRKQIASLRDKMGCARQVDMVRQALAVVA